jgi:lysophospholipase L1-like esterase
MWPELSASILLAAVMQTAPEPSPRFLALGDSYTIGEGVASGDNWPHQLVAAIRREGLDIADAQILARTGWTTDELSAAMDAHEFHPPYALVTLSIGVNNQYRGRDVENYRHEFHALLQRAIALAGNDPRRVVVVSIPDWGDTRFGAQSGRDVHAIARELDAYNAANAQISTTLHARYASITARSRADAAAPGMLAADGLHPSAAAYRGWLQRILPQARSALTH